MGTDTKTGDWQCVDAAEAGLDAARVAELIVFAEAHEPTSPRDMTGTAGLARYEPPPWCDNLGPVRPRGGPNGLVLRGGCIAAEWGDTGRADMTFSVAKSCLALLAGIAVGEGLIGDIDSPVAATIDSEHFASEQNRSITWRHLLTQTSEWEGTLFGKPDLIDRNRQVGAGADNSRKGQHRDLQAPGAYWEYNDVRVNVLALALLEVFRRPLPEVFRDRIMNPIGAGNNWEWVGYDNATLDIDGQSMVSVPGGSHWGGGLWIGSRDEARFARLVLQRGAWNGRQILSREWIDTMLTPIAINPVYGLLWWLNTGGGQYPSAPESGVAAVGAGTNIIWIDRPNDLVMVARWIDQAHVDGLLGRLTACVA